MKDKLKHALVVGVFVIIGMFCGFGFMTFMKWVLPML
jgi:hypothetical protein